MLHEDKIFQTIATNCARLRKARGFTFDALAKRSDVSKGTLVEIEQGRTNPSIATLCRMANAFGVGLGEVLGQEEPKTRLVVHPRAAGRAFWETTAGSCATLVDTVRMGALAAEIWDWRLAPRESFDGEAHSPGTTELLSVMRGTLTVQAGHETVAARAGSTLRLLADVSHRYANPRNVACRFQMVVLEPVG